MRKKLTPLETKEQPLKRKRFLTGCTFLLLLALIFKGSLSFAQTQVVYVGEDLRDPFENQLPQPEPQIERPGAVIDVPLEPIRLPEFTVEGIVSGGFIPQAVIQDKVVRVGDTIEEAVITGITKEGVEMLYQGETFIVSAPSRAKPPTGGQNGQ